MKRYDHLYKKIYDLENLRKAHQHAKKGKGWYRDAVIIAFIANETISLVENAGLMGLPLPEVISKAIDILQKNTGSGE